ncbi:MAG TPA: hypothetical protein PKC18_11625, partial [Lacipirellulaceae bacterium]|nr:hypothetical protein [Lacipirellulaceae bacterium]
SGSSFSLLKPGDIPWEEALRGKDWFHFTGTAPALSEDLAELTLEGCCTAKDLGITVSCDVNYRSALWSVDAARRSMTRIVQNVDVLISNEEHARQVLGAPAATDGCTDPFDARCYEATMRYLREEFDLRAVALTIRAGETSNETTIAALLDDGIKISQSRKYFIRAIDRIGGGDAFTGALIYGLLQCRNSQDTVELAAAASCLKHSVHGDFCHASLDEVESLARTGPNGRVRR